MRIGITYKLYEVRITNSQGVSRNITVNRENLDYLISLLDKRYSLLINCVEEFALVEREDSDTLADYFDDKKWL